MKPKREDLPALIHKLGSLMPGLRREFPVRSMAVFGSVARGESTPESDLDILVDVDPSIGLGFVTLAERLEKDLGRKVDLVSRRSLRPSLLKQIEPELVNVEA
jgi:predicted nucleotidyltransferase